MFYNLKDSNLAIGASWNRNLGLAFLNSGFDAANFWSVGLVGHTP